MTDMQDTSNSVGNTLLVFLLGVAVGATVAILYAPAAGSDTRAQLAEKAGHLKDKASDLSHQISNRASEWKDKVVSRMRHDDDSVHEAVGEAT
jgi:gas vesicle protein